MNPKFRFVLIVLLSVLAVVIQLLPRDAVTVRSQEPRNKVLARQLAIELGQTNARPKEQRLSSGVMYTLLQAVGEIDRRAKGFKIEAVEIAGHGPGTIGCQNVFTGAGGLKNTRVNQDCSFRRQAEEVVVINPTNAKNLIAGQNDSRIGFNHCGYDWSINGGKKWGDQIPPFWQFILEDGHTADACSDPTATFDSVGNAYVGGVLFDIASTASAFIVMKSNAANLGMFYHSPNGNPLVTSPAGVVASDDDPCVFHDKEFIVADATVGSPKANNVYATWTRFSCTNSPIYFSQSTNGGRTWSDGVEISGSNATVCTVFSGSTDPNACDQDQGSHPIVGADGTIYVVFGNGNTPNVGENQVLFVKCAVGNDCSNSAGWTSPVKVGDLIGKHPLATAPNVPGCPIGRQCIPPNGYRAPEFTGMSIAAASGDNLYATWWDTRNLGANCMGNFATATPPCDTDVFYARSGNGGATWSAAVRLTPPGSSQWQSWSAIHDKTLWIAYYDRQYGNCETTGCHDITLTKVDRPGSASPIITHKRITTESMPDLNTLNNPAQAGFLGDYMWVAPVGNDRAAVIWADTRGRGFPFPEEDVYIFIGK